MTFRELEPVVLTRDLPEYGLKKGDLGAVVHVHDTTAVEVEFVRLSGATQALVTLSPDHVRPVDDGDVPAVRAAVGPVKGAI